MSLKENVAIDTSIEQLCGFKIGDGFYGISVVDVQEVIKPQRVTIIPKAPSYIRGLINLRGQIVTQINLRTMFGLEDKSKEEHMNIVVSRGDSLFALVVDEILDVIDVNKSDFENTPNTIDKKISIYIKGVFKLEEGLQVLIDLDKVLNIDV
ncbi:MAG: chemotaxis protein CheW [Bacteriovoracaceae bacterium]